MKVKKLITLLFVAVLIISACGCKNNKASHIPRWGMFESELTPGKSYIDPVHEVTLTVNVKRPDGSTYNQEGFYDGNERWKFRIMPNMEGSWKYEAVFSDSDLRFSGQFRCAGTEKTGPLTVNSNNPVWLVSKDSPPKQIRSFHVGDRFFASNYSNMERLRFLDWISEQGYNMLSVASHYLNRQQEGRGMGWDTPKLWPIDPVEYQKLESYLSELEKRNINVYPFAGFFGRSAEWPTDEKDQELYIRYTLARLSSFRNIIFNVAGPEPLLKPEDYQNGNMKREDIIRLAKLIKKYDPYHHMLSVHNRTKNEQSNYEYDPFIFEPWEDFATLQGGKSGDLKDVYNFISDGRKVIKPVFAQEVLWYGNMYHANLDPETLRKKAITLIMAGSFINFGDMNGNSSSGFSGYLDPDSAHADAHKMIHKVWDIFDQLPFVELEPRPDLVSGALCLSNGINKYLIYSAGKDPFTLNFEYKSKGKWINPRNGKSENLSYPISDNTFSAPDDNDWLLYLEDEEVSPEINRKVAIN